MDETEFEKRAGEALGKLESALRDVDGVDADLAGDILTLEFEDGAKFVINSHSAARQIWISPIFQPVPSSKTFRLAILAIPLTPPAPARSLEVNLSIRRPLRLLSATGCSVRSRLSNRSRTS